MSSTGKGIYHWKLGDVALARICKKVYARVRVIKDEKGLFYDDKGKKYFTKSSEKSIFVTRIIHLRYSFIGLTKKLQLEKSFVGIVNF